MFRLLVKISIASLLLIHLYRLVDFYDFFHSIANAGPRDQCKALEGIENGPEAFQIVHEKNLAIISTGMLKAPGQLLLLNLSPNLQDWKLNKFTFDEPYGSKEAPKMKPHGISIRKTALGIYQLFVINHPEHPHRLSSLVDIFEIDFQQVKLKHLKRIQDHKFALLNGIQALEGDDFKFYATEFLGTSTILGAVFEQVTMSRWGGVFYYDGRSARQVVDNLFYPNGIAASRDLETIYIGSSGDKSVTVYARDRGSGDLTVVKDYPTGTMVDNLALSQDGKKLWFAGTYKMLDLTLVSLEVVAHNWKLPSVLAYWRINEDDSRKLEAMKHVLVDDGTVISGATHAANYGDYMLIGSITNQLTACKVGRLNE